MASVQPTTARRQQRAHITALDIGSQVIKALVVKKEGGEAIVLGVGRAERGPGSIETGVEPDLDSLIEGCHAALEAAEDMAEVIPTRCIIGIGGPNVRALSGVGSRVRGKPLERISRREMDTHVESIQRKALQEANEAAAADAGGLPVELRLVHSSITGAKVDGQPVMDPLRYQGKKLELTIFNTFAPEAQCLQLEDIAQALDLELVEIVAEPYAVARLASTPEVLEAGAIFIDIGARTTSLSLVRGGVLESTRMFDLGGRAFTRKLAHDMDLPLPLAESLKLRYSAGLLAGPEQLRTRRAMGESAEVLAQGVALMLHELAKGQPLPTDVYLSGGGALMGEVMEQLTVLRWTDYLPFVRQPRFVKLSSEHMVAVHDATGMLTTAADITPMALAYQGSSEISEESETPALFEDVFHRLSKALRG